MSEQPPGLDPWCSHRKESAQESIRQITPTSTCFSPTYPYPTALGGNQTITSVALFKRILISPSLSPYRSRNEGYPAQDTITPDSRLSSSSRRVPTNDYQSHSLQRSLIPSASCLCNPTRHLPATNERRTIPTDKAPYFQYMLNVRVHVYGKE